MKQPEFKVGDKVKVRTCDWLDRDFVAKVTMVGIFDSDLAGGIPTPGVEPPVVYGYSVERVRSGWGTYIYKGLPEFYVTSTRKSSV